MIIMNDAKIIGLSNSKVEFLVKSSRDGYHSVTYDVENDAWTCTCEHHQYRGAFCKHMQSAKDELANLNKIVQKSTKTNICNKHQKAYVEKQKGLI